MTSSRIASSVVLVIAALLACLSPAANARQLRQTDVSVLAPYTNVQVQAPGGSPPNDVTAPGTTAAATVPAASPVPCKAKDGTVVYVNAPYAVVDVSAPPEPCPEGAQIIPSPKTPKAEDKPAGADVSVQAPYTDVQVGRDGTSTTSVNVPGITSINVASGRKL